MSLCRILIALFIGVAAYRRFWGGFDADWIHVPVLERLPMHAEGRNALKGPTYSREGLEIPTAHRWGWE